MIWDPSYKPKLRPVEAFPVRTEAETGIGLADPSGFSESALTVSHGALQVIALMDGHNTCEQICRVFGNQFGHPLPARTLQSVIEALDRAMLLDNERFAEAYREQLEAYRRGGTRSMRQTELPDGHASWGDAFGAMLDGTPRVHDADRIAGVIAPHLDYPRGRPCYAAAYANLAGRRPPDRVVILGTNHFGRSRTAAATACDFETPLGRTRVDGEFLRAVENRVGDMRAFELDHVREHSVELQVLWLQHLFGPEAFTIVPILCPDPCSFGPNVAAHLKALAAALAERIDADPADTLVVAGADFSHVGGYFGDERSLDEAFLAEVEEADRAALRCLESREPEAFVSCVSDRDNHTRICSVGCMYTLAAALSAAEPRLLRYHQALVEPLQNCVTCAAVAYTRA